ncbi:hypothetical protein E8E11_004058 [Didymella keratinophila]|nr:hypothetical protein E8E11_004058 [Didymella keratinophila]
MAQGYTDETVPEYIAKHTSEVKFARKECKKLHSMWGERQKMTASQKKNSRAEDASFAQRTLQALNIAFAVSAETSSGYEQPMEAPAYMETHAVPDGHLAVHERITSMQPLALQYPDTYVPPRSGVKPDSRSRRTEARREERAGLERDHEKRSEQRSSRSGPSQRSES